MTLPTEVVDPHVHFIDTDRFAYPWLESFPVLNGGFSPADWSEETRTISPTAVVHVQAEIDHRADPVTESAWLQGLTLPQEQVGVVGYADLRAPDVGETLDRHLAHSRVRGIRQELWYDPASERADVPRENILLDARFRKGLSQLASRALSFDLLVWHHQLGMAADVFGSEPDLPVVLNHLGLPPLADPSEMDAWRSGIKHFADRVPRAMLKVSGLAMVSTTFEGTEIKHLISHAIESFGPNRCMIATNYPVDRIVATYSDIWRHYDELTIEYSDTERGALFAGSARRFYRI